VDFANQIRTEFRRDKTDSDIQTYRYSPPLNIFLKKTDSTSDNRQVFKEILIMLFVFVVYSTSAKLGLKFAFENQSASAVWAPSGIALAVYLLRGYHLWPAVFLGAFIVNVSTTYDISTSLFIAFGNTSEGLIGAYLVDKYAKGKYAFEKPQSYFKFVVLAGILSTVAAATIGVTSLSIEGFVDWSKYFTVWLTWWVGDAVGVFLIAPLIVMWFLDHSINWDKGKIIEAFSLFLATALICMLEFNPSFASGPNVYQFKYILLPAFVWIAYRFSPRDTATAVFIFCSFAIWATLRGLGPFVTPDSPNLSLLYLQSFMSVLTVMSVGFALVISERNKTQYYLKEAHDRLEERVRDRTSELSDLVQELEWEISERKRAEKEIEIFAHTLKSTNECICITNLDDRIIFTNEAFQKHYGYNLDEIVGKHKDIVRRSDMAEKLSKIIHEATLKGGWQGELINKRKDGSEFPVLLSTSVIKDSTGNPIGLLGVSEDITEIKKTESLLKHKNALVKLLQEIAAEANQVSDVEQVLRFTLDRICEFMSWPIGHVYMVEIPDKLISTKIWNTNFSPEFSNFKNITESTPLRSGVGLPGRILESGKPLWVPDVNKDDNFPRAKAAVDIKVKAGFGFPFFTENEIVGVLEFFAQEALEPDESLLEIMYNIGTQLGRVVERQRSIEIITANESRFRAVSETANDAIVSADVTGKIYYFNKSAQETFGYLPHEVLGKPLTILMPEKYQEEHKLGFSRFLETGESKVLGKTIELSGKRKNGEEFPIELSLAKWETNDEIHFTAMIRDITERKKSDEQLKSSERQLKNAQQIARLGSWEWDIPENKVSWSDELYRVYGLTPNEFSASYEGFLERVHPDDVEKVKNNIERAYNDARPFTFHHRIILPDGSVKIIRAEGQVITDESGKPVKMLGTGQDVTEQRKAEEELRATYEKLKETQKDLLYSEKLASLGRFSSGIAHEIRNPLANISALAQIIQKHKVDKNMKQHLKYILANVNIANKIIKDLLDFASPHDVEFEKEDISKIINDIYDIVKTRCEQHNIRLLKKIKPNLPMTMLNEKGIQTAFLNFVSNAIDAMPKGGELKITADKDNSTNELVITFEDTGTGISAGDIDKIFEPFYTTKDEGTGLGLSLAYQVIKSHSGRLDISSQVGHGTRISIRLPIRTDS
jgi:PAS domain S-box-containing protein